MLRPDEATPCPAFDRGLEIFNIRSGRLGERLDNKDSTAQIDFTKEFLRTSQVSGLKRCATASRPGKSGMATNFAIHQDNAAKSTEQDACSLKVQVSPGPKMSVLAQPVPRPRSRVSFASGNTNLAPSGITARTGMSYHTKFNIETDVGARQVSGKIVGRASAKKDQIINKSALRETIYMSSEANAMPTVWMSVFSPIKNRVAYDEDSLSDRATDLPPMTLQTAEKRHSRAKPSVMAGPRRAPLRHSLKPPQEKTIHEDIPGRMTGKENLPPGHEPTSSQRAQQTKKLGGSSRQTRQAPRLSAVDPIKRTRPSSCASENLASKGSWSKTSTQAHGPLKPLQKQDGIGSDHDVCSNFARLRLDGGRKEVMRSSSSDEVFTMTLQLSTNRDRRHPTRSFSPVVTGLVADQNHPLLSEDIQNPSMYENNWLAHQEIAITQLVNELFDARRDCTNSTDLSTIRSQLLMIYQDQRFVHLHKHLQASLLCGSLSMPKEVLAKASRLPEDLGLKRRFLNLWLDTYDLPHLQVCAEVVIGRECSGAPLTASARPPETCSMESKMRRQSLSQYLEMFLVRNEDVFPENGTPTPGTNGVQNTLLRSLMLIQLLDTTKTLPQAPFPGLIFQPSSTYKSSVAVVQALAHLLHPAAANIIRSLSRLGFSVSHVQYPLQEYVYHIDNLAVDLRDGVRLTRLVEQLLYPSTCRLSSHVTDADATMTVKMPTGEEVLPVSQGAQEWPLSRHLKFPCLGRPTKLYNVQIALSALSSIEGVDRIVEDIRAEHIVDGFREKTVALLWGLTSRWALGSLIDWADVKQEIVRLGGTSDDEDDEPGADDIKRHKTLLKEWATVIAGRKGMTIKNLTTSFADGRVFEAIIDEYEPFLLASKTSGGGGSSSSSSSLKVKKKLSQRLAAIGCSAQFASLFVPSSHPDHGHAKSTNDYCNGRIFDRDFTLASLSFLASRLLSASKRARAAMTIQRSWRSALQRQERKRKAVMRRLAEECRVALETRKRGW